MPLPERERAVQLAYRALSSRDRTVVEMRAWLERKRVEPEAIEHAVQSSRRPVSWTTPASPSASPRTSAAWTSGAPSGSGWICSGGAFAGDRRAASRPPRPGGRARRGARAARRAGGAPGRRSRARQGLAAPGSQGLRAGARLRGGQGARTRHPSRLRSPGRRRRRPITTSAPTTIVCRALDRGLLWRVNDHRWSSRLFDSGTDSCGTRFIPATRSTDTEVGQAISRS